MIHPHRGCAGGAALLGLLLLAACGGAEEPAPDRSRSPGGARLVAGAALDEWGLLVVPRRGGPATLRSLRDPAQVVWSGRTPLPASLEAHALEDGLVLLRAPGGEVYRYDPGSDAAERVGRAGEGASWAASGRAGLFLDPEKRELLAVSRSGSWRYSLPHPVEWASPLEPGAVALLVRAAAGPEVWVLREGEERPAASLEAAVTAPAFVTAWGKRIVFAAAEPREALQVLTVSPLAPASRIELGDAVTALAGSPSTHEVYVGLDRPPRLRAVNRFTGRHREIARFRRPPVEVRAAPFGDPLLAHDGAETYRLPVGGGEPERLDAEWRRDLPLALPGGRVLLARAGEVRLLGPGGGAAGEPVDGPADAWWLAVRWTPAPARVLAGRVRGEPLAAGEEAAGEEAAEEGAAGGPPAPAGGAPAAERGGRRAGGAPGREPAVEADPASGGRAGEAGAATREGARVPGPGAAGANAAGAEEAGAPAPGAEDAGPADAGPEDAGPERARRGPAPGFYAIVASARSPGGIADLTRALAAAGYPTAIQAVADDAGEVWHRGLVGPFRSRPEADAAARQLERERRLHAWVTEVAPAGGGALQ